MNPFVLLLMQLLPYLPNIIKTVEVLRGPKNGAEKLSTAMSLIQTLEPTVAPYLTSVENAKVLHNVIGVSVAAMNASGMMPKIEVQRPMFTADVSA